MSLYFPNPEECASHTIFPGVHIRTAAAEKMMLSLVHLEPHAIVPEHFHPHEQVGMLLSGRATFYIGEEQRTLQEGDFYRIPGNTRHKVVVFDQPTRVIDIFYPIREEYL